ncbi:unnamed protein product [Ixodes pacificus]
MLHRGALITPICFFFPFQPKRREVGVVAPMITPSQWQKGWTLPLKLHDYWSMIPIAVLLRWTNKGTPTTGAQGASHCKTHSGISESTTNHDHLYPCMRAPLLSTTHVHERDMVYNDSRTRPLSAGKNKNTGKLSVKLT